MHTASFLRFHSLSEIASLYNRRRPHESINRTGSRQDGSCLPRDGKTPALSRFYTGEYWRNRLNIRHFMLSTPCLSYAVSGDTFNHSWMMFREIPVDISGGPAVSGKLFNPLAPDQPSDNDGYASEYGFKPDNHPVHFCVEFSVYRKLFA